MSKSTEVHWQYTQDFSLPPHKVVWSTIIFVQTWSAFSPGVLFSPIDLKCSVLHLCWFHSAYRCMQIAIGNQSGNHANQYSACNYIEVIVRFCDHWLFHSDVDNYYSVTKWYLKSCTVFVIPAVSPTRGWCYKRYRRMKLWLTNRDFLMWLLIG